MATHSIQLYKLKAYDPDRIYEDDSKYAPLDNVNGHDLIDMFSEYLDLNTQEEFAVDKKGKTVFSVKSFTIKAAGRCVVGVMNAGLYGVPGEIRDSETGGHRFDKSHKDADITDRFFLLFSPSGKNEAILILHAVRGNGVKTLVSNQFTPFFRNKTGLRLRFETLTYDKAVQTWLDAQVKEVRATGFKISSDVTDDIGSLGHHESELVLRPKRNEYLGFFKSFRNKEENKAISYLEKNCRKLKAVVELNGSKRTFTISGAGSTPIVTLDFDDSVFDENDVPDFNLIEPWVVEVVNELCTSIYPSQEIRLCLEK